MTRIRCSALVLIRCLQLGGLSGKRAFLLRQIFGSSVSDRRTSYSVSDGAIHLSSTNRQPTRRHQTFQSMIADSARRHIPRHSATGIQIDSRKGYKDFRHLLQRHKQQRNTRTSSTYIGDNRQFTTKKLVQEQHIQQTDRNSISHTSIVSLHPKSFIDYPHH